MKDIALVVMAAGIGSRFGGGIKQLEPVGPNGEIIMDYSIHDALEAGCNKVVFIIRRDIEQDFKNIIGKRIEKLVPVEYVYQSVNELPANKENIWNRTKPCEGAAERLVLAGAGALGVFDLNVVCVAALAVRIVGAVAHVARNVVLAAVVDMIAHGFCLQIRFRHPPVKSIVCSRARNIRRNANGIVCNWRPASVAGRR